MSDRIVLGFDHPEAGHVHLGVHRRTVRDESVAAAIVEGSGRVGVGDSGGENTLSGRFDLVVERVDGSHLGGIGFDDAVRVGEHGEQVAHGTNLFRSGSVVLEADLWFVSKWVQESDPTNRRPAVGSRSGGGSSSYNPQVTSNPLNDDLVRSMAQLPWYHSIDLPGGVTTPGVVRNARVVTRLRLPASFTGLTVLDVGAWDGFYSFDAARRGASEVLATDSFSWDGRGWGRKESFEFARRALGLEGVVRDLTIDPTEISLESLGKRFDVVLFLGVMYHLEDPIGVLRRVAEVCGDLLVLETEVALNWLPFPAARIFPGAELNSDPTNWFQFNERALVGLLKEVGFTSTKTVYRYPFVRRLARAGRDRMRGKSFRASFYSSRIVIHATRSTKG